MILTNADFDLAAVKTLKTGVCSCGKANDKPLVVKINLGKLE